MSDLDVREIAQCSCLRLRRITRRITHIYDRFLEPTGLTVNQFGLLGRIYGASQRGELLAVGALVISQEGPLQIFEAPGSGAMQQLPWSFIPTVLVPYFLVAHGVIAAQLQSRRAAAYSH